MSVTQLDLYTKRRQISGQNLWVLRYLEGGYTLTPLDALHLGGIFRLAARIAELREAGYRIKTEKHTTSAGKTVAAYRLVDA